MTILLKSRIWYIGIFLVLANQLLAQPAYTTAELSSKYPSESWLYTVQKKKVKIYLKKGQLEATVNVHNEMAILKNQASSLAEGSVYFDDHFIQLTSVNAGTWVPNGSSFKFLKVDPRSMQEVQETNENIFYDSQKYKRFYYPNLTSGTFTELDYTYFIPEGTSLGNMNVQYGVPVLQVDFEVEVVGDIELGYKTLGDFSKVNFSEEKKGNSTIYRWTAKDVPAYKYKDFLMSDDNYRSQLYVFVKSYSVKGEKHELFGNPASLYAYNWNHIKDVVSEEPNQELKNVVDSLQKVATDQEDLVRKTYYWVQEHIRYIAFEDGMGGLVPRACNQVYQQKYGDCKDMATLLYSMLKYGGAPVYPTWIGTREIDFSYSDLAIPYTDNHMIAAYKRGENDFVFLDATSSNIDYKMPSIFTQGKQAMVAIDKDHFAIQTVPVYAYTNNKIADNVSVQLKGDDLILDGNFEMTGYIKSTQTEGLKYKNPKDAHDEWLDILERGNNKCILNEINATGLNVKDAPIIGKYTLTIPDYVKSYGDEYYINFNFDKSFTAMRPDTTNRVERVDYLFSFVDDSKYTMAIPDGYEVKNVPSDLNIENEYYDVTFKYVFDGNAISIEKTFSMKTISIPNEFLNTWIEDLDKISLAYKQVVTLKKKI